MHFSRPLAAAALLLAVQVPILHASPTQSELATSHFQLERTSSGMTVVLDVPPLQWQAKGEDGDLPTLEGAGSIGIAGGPAVPVYSRLLPVPAGMDLALDDVQATWHPVGVRKIAHELGRDDATPRDDALTATVAQQSQEAVTVGHTTRWRDIRFAPVTVRPFRLDPQTGEGKVADRMELHFRYVPSAEPDGFDPPGVSEALLPLYNEYVPGSLDDIDPASVVRGTYLIITADTYLEAIDPLIKWRKRNGFHVIVAPTSETGTTTSDIHTYIDNIYESANPPLDYVLIVGDVDTPSNIPTYFISPGVPNPYDPEIATDQKYTYDIAGGTDYGNVLPRYLVGRISVDNSIEARTVVNKVLQYERDPMTGNPERWLRAVTVADASWAISTAQTQDWVAQKLTTNGFTNVTQLVRTQTSDPGAAGVMSAINNNVSWVTYRGFGSHTSWSGPYVFNDHVTSMATNTNNIPVITSMVCGGGAFDEEGSDDPCFGEVWLRLGTASNPKGAVAFIAPSEIDTHTRWNNMMLAGWYTALFDQGLRTTGQCLISAKMQLYNNYPGMWNANGTNENSVWFYFHTYNILGDPALQLRAEMPQELQVSHPAEISPGASYVPVTVTDDTDLPVPDAWVVVTEDENTILGMARTNASGIANVELVNAHGDGQLALTVTEPAHIPYLADLGSSSPRGAILNELLGVEDLLDPATNGDNALNPGEMVLPQATFEVVEPGGMQNVTVSVAVPEGAGEVTVPTQSFGDLNESATFQLTDPRIRLANTLENGTRVPVIFTIQGTNRTVTQMGRLQPVEAPVLFVDGATYSDSYGPGDTTAVVYSLRNDNSLLASGAITAELELADPRVTLLDSLGAWTNVPGGATGVSASDGFVLAIDSDAYPGRTVEGTLVLTTEDGYVQRRDITFEVSGAGPTSPTGPVGPGYYMYEDVDVGYDHLPAYTWQSIVGQPNTISLGINDYGNNQDETVQTDLPFSFPYWDDFFDQISVCSNGWLAFGNTDLFFFRNRPIPGPLSPRGGLCPFWDDLALNFSNSGVYAQYDEENNWYTVEWHNVRPYQMTGQMSFQVRLLDPEVYGTPGGLGQFVFLYDHVINTDGGENYATVGIISPDGTEAMQVEFNQEPAPTASGVVDGRQMLFAAREGDGLTPPDVSVSTPALQMNAVLGGQGTARLRIRNDGGRSARIHIVGEGVEGVWAPTGELDQSGGPDAAGYRWYDSREFYGPDFAWQNIEEAGNEVDVSGGGNEGTAAVSGPIELPFSFPYYGDGYSTFWICEAGYITFADPGTDGSSTNTDLPRSFAPHLGIFPFWDNIARNGSGHIYADVNNDRAVVTWAGLTNNGTEFTGPYTFQVILAANGEITVQYGDMSPSYISATVGIQNDAGVAGLEVSANASTANFIEDNLALRFVPGLPWLSIAPEEVGIPGGESAVVTLTGLSEGLAPGLYRGRVAVRSPLSDQAFTLPVEFFISSNPIGAAPVIRTLPGESIAEGGSFTPFGLDPYVEDWDNVNGDLSWTAYNTGGLDVSIDDDHVVSISAPEGWTGPASVTYRVSDDQLNYDEYRATYSLGGENDPPRFDSASPEHIGRIDVGTVSDFDVTGSDPEGDDVSYEWFHGVASIGTGTTATVSFDRLGPDTVRVVATDSQGHSSSLFWAAEVHTPSAAGEDADGLPSTFAVEALYPNPFNANVVLRYALPRSSAVKVHVYNLLGREVARRTLTAMPAGRHEMAFNATDWASGLYFVRWEAGSAVEVRKAVLLK